LSGGRETDLLGGHRLGLKQAQLRAATIAFLGARQVRPQPQRGGKPPGRRPATI
jgi:hypothetical protein